MRVALVTNWDQKCAVAEYAKNLAYHCTKNSEDVEFRIVTGVLNYEGVEAQTRDVDIIHFNYCRHAFMPMDPKKFNSFRGKGKPVILTFHESSDWQTRRLAATPLADWVVVHDKLRDGPPPPINVRPIPFGVPEYDLVLDVDLKVGTFGCAFPWKGLYPLAWACGQLGFPLMAMLSEADPDKGDIQWETVEREILSVCPQAEIIKGWRPEKEIVQALSNCAMVALPFDAHSPITGISASVRFALASKRPVVLTRFAHFSDLYDYEDEIYFTDGNLKETLSRVYWDIRRGTEKAPVRVLQDMSWNRSAQLYLDLYREALVSKVEFLKESA